MIGVPSVFLSHGLLLGPCMTDLLVGAFVAAPIGGLLWGFGAFVLRIGFQWILSKLKGRRFDALDKPTQRDLSSSDRRDPFLGDDHPHVENIPSPTSKGKFS